LLEVKTKTWDFGDIIEISNELDTFEILFGGNGDLYFSPKMKRIELFDLDDPIKFIITLDDNYLYEVFNDLYNNIINYKVSDNLSSDFLYQKRVDISRKYPLVNNNIISWHSDEDEASISSILNISKENDNIILEFNKSRVDDDMYKTYSIRFRNSGSTYKPFNFSFVELYNKLCDYYFNNKILQKK
jgi:hypothetical protein